MKKIWSAIACTLCTIGAFAQSNFYAEDTIQQIHIYISNPNWDYNLDTAKIGQEGYSFADSVVINGITFDSVGVRYKGNSSYDSASKKNPWHIELNHFKEQEYFGVKDIKLGNMYKDPSLIREFLAYKFLHKCMKGALANFAQLYVNGNYVGLYTNVQQLNNSWAKNNIGADGQLIVKCNPIGLPGLTTKSNFKKTTANDSASYAPYYEVKSEQPFQQVIDLIDSINNSTDLRRSTNIDGTLWMLAFNTVFANLDSYSGVFAQNHYVFKDNYSRYHNIMWDLNMCFGGFPYLGNQNSSLSAQSITGLKNLSLFPHNGDTYWPLINRVYNDAQLKKEYLGHIKALGNWIDSASTWIANARTLIDTAVQADSNLAYGYSGFNNSLITDINVGNYSVPALQTFLDARKSYVDSTFNAAYVVPTIASVNVAGQPLSLFSTANITAICSNEQKVYCAYRYNKFGPYYRQEMYDDGLHGDGIANDNIYGTWVGATGIILQYYIIAEGANTTTFLPAGAEHSFFELSVAIPKVAAGDVRLSEVMANNTITAKDSNGQYDDWVELIGYKSWVPLCALFLSDDASNTKKWQFPSDAFYDDAGDETGLPIIWCDNDVYQQGMHANFKLNDSASAIYLSNIDGDIIDSLVWPGKMPQDLSAYICEGQQFIGLQAPTFTYLNCGLAINSVEKIDLQLVPNPTTNFVEIRTEFEVIRAEVFNIYGQRLLSQDLTLGRQINLSNLCAGAYILLVDGVVAKKLIKN
jgi:spore coat protein CotH